MTLFVLDLVAGLLLIKLMTEVTPDWGWHDRQAKWALLRRVVLFATAIAFLVKAAYRAEYSPADWIDGGSQIVIIGAIVIFPLLRAFGVISQDRWGPSNGAEDG